MAQKKKEITKGIERTNYFQESFQELKKVTWPTRNKAIRLTFIVLGLCLFSAVLIGATDLAFNQGYRSMVNYAATINPSTPETSPLQVIQESTQAQTVTTQTTSSQETTQEDTSSPTQTIQQTSTQKEPLLSTQTQNSSTQQ